MNLGESQIPMHNKTHFKMYKKIKMEGVEKGDLKRVTVEVNMIKEHYMHVQKYNEIPHFVQLIYVK
jgi:hypothetical protein